MSPDVVRPQADAELSEAPREIRHAAMPAQSLDYDAALRWPRVLPGHPS